MTTRTSSLSSDTVAGLFDELTKISSDEKNEHVRLKKFLKATAVIGAGAGAGYGAGMLADKAFHHAFGTKWQSLPTPTKNRLVGAALGLATAGAFVGKEWLGLERKGATK